MKKHEKKISYNHSQSYHKNNSNNRRNHSGKNNKPVSVPARKESKSTATKTMSRTSYKAKDKKDYPIILAGVKTGLHMIKLGSKQKTDFLIYQKNNPIPKPMPRNYPKDAVPSIIHPDTSQKLISSVSGNPVSDPLTVFNKGASEDFVDFDEAIKYIQVTEDLKEGQEIRYIGSGKFAVITIEEKNKKQLIHIVRTIEFEAIKETRTWREKLQYRAAFIEIDSAEPFSDMYSQEELDSFREFNA